MVSVPAHPDRAEDGNDWRTLQALDRDAAGVGAGTGRDPGRRHKATVGRSRRLTIDPDRTCFERWRPRPGNVVLSPTSIGTAMAMVLAGARGETEAEMRQVLRHTLSGKAIDAANAQALAALLGNGAPSCPDGFKLSGRLCEAPAPKGKDAPCPHDANRDGALCVTDARASKATLRIANALMLVNPSATIADSFRDTIRTKYNAEIFPGADLATVNNWVKEKTEGKIPTILDKLSPNDSHVLLNAIYFNAPWAHAFAKTATREREFHLTAQRKGRGADHGAERGLRDRERRPASRRSGCLTRRTACR